MKIRRFNAINETLTKEIREFIQDFSDSTDYGIPGWIDAVIKQTKLKNYPILGLPNKKAIEFATQNNLKKLLDYISIDEEIEQKEEEISKLHTKREKLSTEASNELFYKFQEDLINNDFNSFITFFMGTEEDLSSLTDEEKLENYEIHPNILKKYKEKILLNISTNKYNL